MNGVQDKGYLAPESLAELMTALEISNQPKLICGGTDLLVQLHGDLLHVNTIIDVKKIPRLNELGIDQDGLTIGAAVTCSKIAQNQEIVNAYPGLVDAVKLVGSVQIQNRSSIGGNLCNGSPAADTIAILIANQARCTIHSRQGDKSIPVQDFVLGPGKTVLAADEFLVNIRVPHCKANSADAYLRLIPRSEMDIAVAGAAVRLAIDTEGTCTSARVAISAVAPRPVHVESADRAILNTNLDEKSLKGLQQAVRDAADPISDKRATREYRLHVIGVLTKRAALIAHERATSVIS
jgi:carbon-monoxide dehydrogenase medium subunit